MEAYVSAIFKDPILVKEYKYYVLEFDSPPLILVDEKLCQKMPNELCLSRSAPQKPI
jgi:hypothetical protein